MHGTTNLADSRPTLKQLSLMKTKTGVKIEVIKSLAPQWKQLGILLDFDTDGAQLDLIEYENGQQNPQKCCLAMIRYWMAGNGEQPATWRKLIELLRDCEKDVLAAQLERELST